MLRELLKNRKNVVFSLPYVALAQEKVIVFVLISFLAGNFSLHSLCNRFLKVRSLAPFGLDLNFYVEEYVGGKGKYPPHRHSKKNSIYVCTTEKAAGLIDSLLDANRLMEIGMLVVDEIHLIGEPKRGPILEMMLTKLLFVSSK